MGERGSVGGGWSEPSTGDPGTSCLPVLTPALPRQSPLPRAFSPMLMGALATGVNNFLFHFFFKKGLS